MLPHPPWAVNQVQARPFASPGPKVTSPLVKLCRFVLIDAPEQPRSGVYHEGRVYETDGERAIGIHEPGTVSFLPPLGAPSAVRVFEGFRRPSGDRGLTYRFLNTTGFRGPNSLGDAPPAAQTLDFDVHVAAAVADFAESVEPREAPSFILGYLIMIVLYDSDMAEEERTLGLPLGPSHDFGGVLGPYLTTPEDLAEFTLGSDPTEFAWRYRVRVNETEIAAGVNEPPAPASDLLSFSSRLRAVNAGELLAWPALEKPGLDASPLERFLTASDRIEVTVDGLGTLVARLS